ncbi:hypothetical protein LTS18_010361 [Coniosporium uncinatum]|uniref:Uncharacterized protein n=1 Tax=Coniosporium uncinatum TaxID=93489 RepID=A0ACC3DWC0_9PEZI|nr:hypothetical protein LTS18_010361 [Coniosporium uncinatum]
MAPDPESPPSLETSKSQCISGENYAVPAISESMPPCPIRQLPPQPAAFHQSVDNRDVPRRHHATVPEERQPSNTPPHSHKGEPPADGEDRRLGSGNIDAADCKIKTTDDVGSVPHFPISGKNEEVDDLSSSGQPMSDPADAAGSVLSGHSKTKPQKSGRLADKIAQVTLDTTEIEQLQDEPSEDLLNVPSDSFVQPVDEALTLVDGLQIPPSIISVIEFDGVKNINAANETDVDADGTGDSMGEELSGSTCRSGTPQLSSTTSESACTPVTESPASSHIAEHPEPAVQDVGRKATVVPEPNNPDSENGSVVDLGDDDESTTSECRAISDSTIVEVLEQMELPQHPTLPCQAQDFVIPDHISDADEIKGQVQKFGTLCLIQEA